jgi:uncharacterized protein
MGASLHDVVSAYVGAFARGDLDAAREHLSEDIVYHVTGTHDLAGDYHGRDDVLAFFRTRAQRTGGTFRYAPHDMLAGDQHAVALGSITAQRDGQDFAWNVITVYHADADAVTECWIVDADPEQAVRAFRG